jgi:hypothetical protein
LVCIGFFNIAADDKRVEVEEHLPEQKSTEEDKPAGFTQLFGGGVSNITKFVESTGSSIFSTGLDTLELLGKKTINVLQQSDPGLKRTKAVLAHPLHGSQDRPCLSQVDTLLIYRKKCNINQMTRISLAN